LISPGPEAATPTLPTATLPTAIDGGSDVSSLLRSGIAALDADDPEGAAALFREVLEHDPENVPATYDLALCADRIGNYHDAREGYLATLRLDRSYADARYNLALLTYRAGALPEARHHLDELAAIAPDDARIAPLRASLALELDATSVGPTTIGARAE
jgi:Flp pilus assembly protein TadD